MAKQNRDNFSETVKQEIAKKVSYLCSYPTCRCRTVASTEDSSSTMSIGVAAHICAAAPGGPRYDASMSADERKSENNGIWLCQTHSVIIDRDEKAYPAELLRQWKTQAQKESNIALKMETAIDVSQQQLLLEKIKRYVISLNSIDKNLLFGFLKNNNDAVVIEDSCYHGSLLHEQEKWFDILDKFEQPHQSVPIKNVKSKLVRIALPYPVVDSFTKIRLNYEIYELLKQINESYNILQRPRKILCKSE